jgi:hypothetical protein
MHWDALRPLLEKLAMNKEYREDNNDKAISCDFHALTIGTVP